MNDTRIRVGEFELIKRHFAPLARLERGALGLSDDAAHLSPRAGCEFVVTADAIVEGVHFLKADPPFQLAQKALRVNLSDLAAKCAKPRAYVMTTAWPSWVDEEWIASFARGLAQDQAEFGIHLIGGDTVSTPGPLTISITAMGEIKKGAMLKRAGAKHGDRIWVSGTIGDAGLGLAVLRNELEGLTEADRKSLVNRFQVPQPRTSLALLLAKVANAAIDVSDGLVADVGHLAAASKLGAEINADRVPFSPAAVKVLGSGKADPEQLLVAGDDYEIAFAAPASHRKRILAWAARTGIAVTEIGRLDRKVRGVTVYGANGQALQIVRTGFTHF